MNYYQQFGPGITETPEQLKQKQQQEENDKKRKLEEEKYSKEFSNSLKSKIEDKLNTLESSLINEKEKNSIVSKLEAIYVNNKLKGLDFNLNKELIKIIKTMSFEAAGDFSEKNYLVKNNEIRKKIISQLKGETKDPFKDFHDHQKKGIYDPNDTIPATEIPQFEDTGIENINNLNEKVKDNPIYPLIERLAKAGQISQESFSKISKSLQQSQDLDLKNLKISPEDKKTLEGYINNLNFNSLNRKQNLFELTKDIKKIPTLKDLNIKTNPDGTFKDEELNKVGKNYIKVPDSNKNFDIEKDLSTAIKITKNEILKEVKNLKKDSETYKQAIKNIDSGNLKKQLKGIKSLYILAYSNEGKLGKTTIENYKKSRKKNLIKEAQKIEQILQQEKLNKQQQEQLEQRKKEIKKELSEITGIKDGKKIEGGDIFKATKQETNDNGQIEKEKTT